MNTAKNGINIYNCTCTYIYISTIIIPLQTNGSLKKLGEA